MRKLKNSYISRSQCNTCRKIDKIKWKQNTSFSIKSIINKIKENKLHGFRQSPSIVKVVEYMTNWMIVPTWKQRIYHIKNETKKIDTCICCDNVVMFMDYKKEYSEYAWRNVLSNCLTRMNNQ